MISGSDGMFRVINPVSQRTDDKDKVGGFIDGQDQGGAPLDRGAACGGMEAG